MHVNEFKYAPRHDTNFLIGRSQSRRIIKKEIAMAWWTSRCGGVTHASQHNWWNVGRPVTSSLSSGHHKIVDSFFKRLRSPGAREHVTGGGSWLTNCVKHPKFPFSDAYLQIKVALRLIYWTFSQTDKHTHRTDLLIKIADIRVRVP